MRRSNRMFLLICIVSLFVTEIHPGHLFAAATDEITSTPAAQAGSIESQQPLAPQSGSNAAA